MTSNILFKKLLLTKVLAVFLLTASTVMADDKTNFTLVLDWSINTNHTGIVVADKLGYFQNEGITVNIESPPPTGGVSLVVANKAQLAVSYQEETTIALSRDLPILAVATIIQHNTSGFASPKKTGITRPADFANKTYGGWGGDVELAMLKSVVENDGGDFDSMKIVPIGDLDYFSATKSGIDIAWVFEGWTLVEAKLKNIELNYIPIASVEALDYYTPILITSTQFASTQPQQLKKLLRAISKGYRFSIANPQRAADILLEHSPELNADLVHASQKFLADKYQAEAKRWGEMSTRVWQRFADWMRERKLVNNPFDAENAFSNDYLPIEISK